MTDFNSSVTLVVVPGPGMSTVEIAEGATLAQFAADNALNGRQLIVNGEAIAPDAWSDVRLEGSSEIFATGTVKGN